MEHPVIKLKIITLDGIYFSGDVLEIVLPTDSGQIAILPHHIPMVSTVKEGIVIIKMTEKEKKVSVSSGVLEVRPQSEVFMLVDRAVER